MGPGRGRIGCLFSKSRLTHTATTNCIMGATDNNLTRMVEWLRLSGCDQWHPSSVAPIKNVYVAFIAPIWHPSDFAEAACFQCTAVSGVFGF
jgi:hypothetical protein